MSDIGEGDTALIRSRIVVLAITLALVGAVIPIAAAWYFSWRFAVEAQQDSLAIYAGQTIARANADFTEATDALRTISNSALEPCSHDHIAQMRKMAIDARSIAEVGFFQNGLLTCTSWGMTEERIMQARSDYTTPDGVSVSIRIRPIVSTGKSMMALQYKNYNVLVDPIRFVDIVVDPGVRLAIATENGALIAESNAPDPGLLRQIIANPHNGMNDHDLFAVAHGNGWMAIAMQSRDGMLNQLRRQQIVLLPVGALIAILIVGLVVRFSRMRLSPLGELTIAVQKREFVVHYQPIVDLRSGRWVGAEALVRWQHPDGSMVGPDIFIPLAEASGLIIGITDQVVEMMVADLGALLVANPALHVAVNVCAADIKSGRILSVVGTALERTGIETSQIWLEVTERAFMDVDSARATITRARELGHPVAIDDFGTGYSSLQYLEGFPLDALKIDKSFIDTIGRNTATSSVTPYIIDMARALKLHVIAEGVETAEQADYLSARAVDYCQGWLFAKAMPAEAFIALYRQNRVEHEPAVAQVAE
jgi:sensor c-di-GMP phosphodiesterase-like protein